MTNREPFGVDEWYHCYNRGVDKRTVFETVRDYERFTESLYLCNNSDPIHYDHLKNVSHATIFEYPRQKPIVAIGAYCLMPNHFHLLIKEVTEGGITQFMRRLGTAYTMYFNIKNSRTGNLFVKPFRSRHIIDDSHFNYLPHYIHLNACELFDSNWKTRAKKDRKFLERVLKEYTYSSFPDYYGADRPQRAILDPTEMHEFSNMFPVAETLINEAAAYYEEQGIDLLK